MGYVSFREGTSFSLDVFLVITAKSPFGFSNHGKYHGWMKKQKCAGCRRQLFVSERLMLQ